MLIGYLVLTANVCKGNCKGKQFVFCASFSFYLVAFRSLD